MKIAYIDGIRLKQGVIAGARRVIMMQDQLNRINVFPVPDNDTGTNMALTMQSIAEGAISCHEKSIALMSQCLADSALMGARGNSGAILAQFFQGLADKFKDFRAVSLNQFAEGAIQARDSSYEALTEPKEGTILTVIHEWAEIIRKHCHHAHDFIDLFKEGLQAAQQSLSETPKKLRLLAKAGVVDAGAQGFVHMLEGVHHFIHSGKIEKSVSIGDGKSVTRAKIEKAPEDITFQYCTECFIESTSIDRLALRNKLQGLGNSLIVAGSNNKVRVHIHSNAPARVFEIASEFGKISEQKFDDMRKQHEAAYSDNDKSKIALVTDSSCDLNSEFIIKHNIQMVPVQLSFGNEKFIDRITITPKEFYRLLEKSKHYPKTSQPTPGDFRTAYKEILGHYDQVISINLSGAVSGTLQAAQTAARTIDENKIKVIDSKSTSVALGLIVAEAAKAIAAGLNFDEVVNRVEQAIKNVRFFICFDTVKYLIKGGRLSKSRGLLAKVLNLKPIITLDQNGKVINYGKTLGGEAALNNIMKLVRQEAAGKRNLKFAIAHANAFDKAAWFKHEITRFFEVRDILIVNVSPALGAHAGPGAAGVAFLGE